MVFQPKKTADPSQRKDADFNPKALYTFGVAHFFNDLANTGLIPVLVVMYKQAFDLNYTESTLIVLVSYFTSSVMQPVFGIFTDRKPRLWMFPLGVFLSLFGLSLTAVAPSLPWLLLFVAIAGIGSGMFHPEASRGTHFAAGNRKNFAQAIFQVGGNAGQAFGPLLIPLFLVHTGIDGLIWFIPVSLLTLLFTVPILKWLNERTASFQMKRKTLSQGKNHLPGVLLLLIIVILRSWCQVGVVIFLPFYFSHLSLAEAEILNFVFVGAGALGTLIGGMLSDRFGMKRLLVFSMAAATPFALVLPISNGFWAVLSLFLFGFSVLSSFSVSTVYMQKLLPKNISMASGLTIGFGVGAGGIGSLLMGGISDIFGVSVVFSILSFLPLIGGILSIFLPAEKTLESTSFS